jgi:hypothetical protein
MSIKPSTVLLSAVVVALCSCNVPTTTTNLPVEASPTPSPTPSPSPTPVNPDTLGFNDAAEASGYMGGWALSKSQGATPINVAFYFDNTPATGSAALTIQANVPRPDVNQATGVPGNHGFAFFLPDYLMDGKSHVIHAYGIGPSGPFELAQSPHTVTPLSATPEGYLDIIDNQGVAAGWALTPARDPNPIQVAFSIDGPAVVGMLTANEPRPDVNQNVGVTGDHGYHFTIPASYKDGNTHKLYAYALPSLLNYLPTDSVIGHQSGYAVGTSWATDVTKTTENYLSYGPYTNALPAGNYVARFILQVDNNTADAANIARLDVFNSGAVLAQKELLRTDFSKVNAPVTFDLPFTVTNEQQLEFRVYYHCCTYLQHVGTAIYRANNGVALADPVLVGNAPMNFMFAPPPPPPPTTHTRAQILDAQGDVMIWGGPEFALNCGTGTDPETGIKCSNNNGAKTGWVWSLDLPLYTPARREALYQRILSYGYTHVTLQVPGCTVGDPGYHSLYAAANTAALCNTGNGAGSYGALLNNILKEIKGHGLITWCTGVAPGMPPAAGLDSSLCDLALDDWDGEVGDPFQKDCRINTLAQYFPNSLHIIEMPGPCDPSSSTDSNDGCAREIRPKKDSCTPSQFAADGTGFLTNTGGGTWIQAAQQRDPNFVGVAIEANGPDQAATLRYMTLFNTWWRDIVQNRFEMDIYNKYWSGGDFNAYKTQDDWYLTNAPWLHGFMSGGTTHAPPTGGGPVGSTFSGELDINQATLESLAGDFKSWPITTHITKITISSSTAMTFEMDNGRPNAWPDTPDLSASGGMGPLLFSIGIAEKINGTWYASAPIQTWRGEPGAGGDIRVQNVVPAGSCGPNMGQIPTNWFYDGRWGPMRCYDPAVGETIGVFICAGDCRAGNGGLSTVHERSNVVLFSLPGPSASDSVISAP